MLYQRHYHGICFICKEKVGKHNLTTMWLHLRSYTSNFNYCQTLGYLFYKANRKSLTCPAPNSTYLPLTQKSSRERNGITLKRNTAITQYTHGHVRTHGKRAHTRTRAHHTYTLCSSSSMRIRRRGTIYQLLEFRAISATRLITVVN